MKTKMNNSNIKRWWWLKNAEKQTTIKNEKTQRSKMKEEEKNIKQWKTKLIKVDNIKSNKNNNKKKTEKNMIIKVLKN